MELKAYRKDGSEIIPEYSPDNNHRFFVYDPDDHTHSYFSNTEDRDLYAEEIISSFYDNEWFDGVESVICGEITHTTEKTTSIPRPTKGKINLKTWKDKDGNDWSDNLVVEICSYGIMPIDKPLPDVKAIVKDYLERHGYDGLVGINCGCLIDDLMPCKESGDNCNPGYRVTNCINCTESNYPGCCLTTIKGEPCHEIGDDE